MVEYNIGKEYLTFGSGHSSRGTQVKYHMGGYWYKTNNVGNEALAEELTSKVLECSNHSNFVQYEMCIINGKTGCRSKHFLNKGESFITLQRLYQSYVGGELVNKMRTLSSPEERFAYLVDLVNETIGMDISNYLRNTFSLDMLICNPDRHFHNLGIIADESGGVREAPIFDNGQGLAQNFSITPPYMDHEEKCGQLMSASISGSFEAQVAASGNSLKIDYDKLYEVLNEYADSPAKTFLIEQLEKYKNIFKAHHP